MRIIFLSLFFISGIGSYGQDTMNNFKAGDSKVVWQKRFAPNYDIENHKYKYNISSLVNKMKLSGSFTNIDTADGIIIARLSEVIADYKGAGYKKGTTEIFLTQGNIDGFVSISISSSVINISISKIVFIQKEDNLLYKVGEKTNIESISLNNKGQFKRAKLSSWSSSAKILDYTFNQIFDSFIK